MSSLSDKLKSLGVQIGADEIEPRHNVNHPPNLIDILPGRWKNTPHGETFIVKKRFPIHSSLGAYSLHPPSSLQPVSKWNNDPPLNDVSPDEFAYIDTETTGLSGGSGTYTFLIGVGRFQDGHFVIKQFFMRDPSEETAQLSALEQFLAPVKAIVTYNGKAFDLPRLQSRYISHRWPSPLQDTSHIDLLHLARRLWKDHLPSCTLGDIEFHILGFERSEENVPGWKVADLFFEYLQTENPLPLKGIFYHNEVDVLSMVALFNKINNLLDDPAVDDFRYPGVWLSIGKFFSDIAEYDRAISAYKRVLRLDKMPSGLQQQATKLLSFIHKRRGNYQSAIPLWEQAAKTGEIYAHVELAKYFEHHEKSYQEAIHWTLSAKAQIEDRGSVTASPKSQSILDKLDYRLQRLKRKLS